MFSAVIIVVVVSACLVFSDDSIQFSDKFGGPHGKEFSDDKSVVPGQVVEFLTLHVGERSHGLELKVAKPSPQSFSHGGEGGAYNTLVLGEGEYITSMEVHTAKQKAHTRVFYLKFDTNKGNSVSGGSMTDHKFNVAAPEGFQLGGFHGRQGGELDMLGAIWTRVPEPVPGTVVPANLPVPNDNQATQNPPGRRKPTQLSESFGGPHGDQFSDQDHVTSGQVVEALTIHTGKRSHGLELKISGPTATTFSHGGSGGASNTLTLGPGEYITSMEAHSAKKDGWTRVFYLKFGTNTGRSVSGGTMTGNKGFVTAPAGYQLGGFFGRKGDELDMLGVVWSSIDPVKDVPPTTTPSDENIVLSEVFGGPHGIAFSDINSIKYGQTVNSLIIHTGARSHGISLDISAPLAATLSHGTNKGTEHKLVLGPGEYITSMEVHWGKKDGRTRIFHLNFGTSGGNSISGGQTTNDKKVITAPEGFQLSGFHGRAEGEIWQLGAIWTRIGAADHLLADKGGHGNDTYGISIRNWVGPNIGKPGDTACYRKSVGFGSEKKCPLGYASDDDDCLTQCPLAYPVRCYAECIPQNDDCALEIVWKVGSVVAVAFNVATLNVFGELYAAYKATKWALLCATSLISVVRSLIYYIRYQQTTAPQGKTEELLAVAYQADVVVVDLPIAVCSCLGLPIPKNSQYADMVLTVVEGIVKQVITNGDEILSTGANALDLLLGSGALNDSSTTIDELQTLIDKNSTCGWELKRLTDRVISAVNNVRNDTPDATANDIRVKVYSSPIVLHDIPTVTNNCMGELLTTKTLTVAYETRDMLRKTFGVIVDQLIDTATTDMGKAVAQDEYMRNVANMGLVALSTVDPTGIAYMASQFVQPICGPTAYLGEIDDGTLHDALGLRTVDEAFEGSYGSWTKLGDGVVRLIFESTDKLDVTVVIHSGGDDYAKVDVKAWETVVWESTIPELQDKSLYLDRWRPGLFGLPGSGGGSLLLWIPRSTEGGHVTMHVRINVS
ncbi:hypothetical protein PHMEG_00022189 [Phytophthora megakarya]|uniref:Jacalin-type lectin domain-containing protein n=1 Tax=Phytophthora megakarya TaxID=4795 RepID=A0A225VL05_9STRA|nr:hypothetical protein PHMEG_00022189 [Phytophthora megakarya]